jgi:hypothetical protein
MCHVIIRNIWPSEKGQMTNTNCTEKNELTMVIAIRVTRRVLLEEQKLTIIPKHLTSPPVFSGVDRRTDNIMEKYKCHTMMYKHYLES